MSDLLQDWMKIKDVVTTLTAVAKQKQQMAPELEPQITRVSELTQDEVKMMERLPNRLTKQHLAVLLKLCGTTAKAQREQRITELYDAAKAQAVVRETARMG